MARPLRLALAAAALLAGAALLAALALGAWLYHAARARGAPDRPVAHVEYPDAAPPPARRPPPRFTTGPAGDAFEILDAQGRVARFRGINLGQGAQVPPFQPVAQGDEDALRDLKAWGFNALRLAVPWEALEPESRGFGMEYLAYVRWLLGAAERQGMVVVLAHHQQDVSRCLGGSGAPPWAHRPGLVPDEVLAAGCRDRPPPGLADLPRRLRWWADFYESHWTPDDISLQDHLIWAWQRLAEVIRGHPALLGYDLLEAPWCPEGWLQGLLDPQEQDCRASLSTFYRRFAKALRAVDPDALILFQPPAATPGRDPEAADALERPPFPGTVLALRHREPWPGDGEACDPVPARQPCGLQATLRHGADLAARLGVPHLLVDHGVRPCRPGAAADLAHQAADVEDAGVSAFAWNYWKAGPAPASAGLPGGGEDHSLVVPGDRAGDPAAAGRPRCLLSALVRPYPVRVPGTDLRWSFDRSLGGDARPAVSRDDGRALGETDVFTLEFRQGEARQDAFVWVPRRSVYGDDPSSEAPEFTVDVSDGTWRFVEGEEGLLAWTPDPEVERHRLSVTPWGGRRAPGNGLGACVEDGP